jgi:transposase
MMTLADLANADMEVKRLDHLGLVAGMCNELGLVDYFDKSLPSCGPDKKLSHGQLVLGMIINGLGYTSQPLYMYPEYMQDKPLERLMGKGIIASDFNQHSLGRTLDQLYECDVSDLYSKFALKVVNYLGLQPSSLHLDSTSFHVDGDKYNDVDDKSAVQITHGYSRDHRPDLHQVILNLIVDNHAGIPLFMQANDGNSSDKSNFAEIVNEHTESLKAAISNRYIVGDSALYTPDSITAIHNNDGYFVTRVPSIIKEAKELSVNTKVDDMINIGDGYYASETKSEYANIPQRWLVIFSEKAFHREIITLDKNLLKQSEKEAKQFIELQNQVFLCETDAMNALNLFIKKCKHIDIAPEKPTQIACYNKKGRPTKNANPDYYEYFVNGYSYVKLATRDALQKDKGFFILATNDFTDEFAMDKILEVYKSQQSVERGFRFLKSPEFFTSSFYLKKPARIEALLMVMTLCLLIYCAIQYKIRQELFKQNKFFPDQKGKDYQSPTARWVFFCFWGLNITIVNNEHTIFTQLKPRQKIILELLGKEYQKIYLKNEDWR